MDNLIIFINTNSGLIGTIIGIGGIAYAIYSNLKNKKKKILGIFIEDTWISSDLKEVNDISILYKYEPIINDFVISKIEIKNIGNDIIETENIADKKPIEFYAESGKLLGHKVIKEPDKGVSYFKPIEVDVDENFEGKKLRITFDFIEQNKDAIILVYYDRNNDVPIKYSGKIKNNGRIVDNTQSGKRYYYMVNGISFIIVLFSILISFLTILKK